MEETGPLISEDCIVHDKWRIIELIAQGGFGSIFKAHNVEKKSEIVAIKTEKRANRDYLTVESDIYSKLKGVAGFPNLIWFGKTKFTQPGNNEKLPCMILVMEYLSSSLSDLFTNNNKKFSLKSVLMLSEQMIDRLATLHSVGIVHRDVKPGNFVMGKGENSNVVYLIDFGLAHSYLDETSNNHIPYASNVCFRGTHRYASVTAHARIEQSRRDDMEALGYVLVYFLNGLPWQNLQVDRKDRRKVIGDIKAKLPLKKLTEGLPVEFEKYMNYTRSLRFTDEPNYAYLKSLFSGCLKKLNFANDQIYDWMSKGDSDPKSEDIFVDEDNVATTPTDKDNSYNNDYQERLATKTKRDDHRIIDEDEDKEYYPVSKKKKVTNQKFISQTQNDWNSDEYVEAKNEAKNLFIENQHTSKPTKKVSNNSNGKIQTPTTSTKKVAVSRDRKIATKPNTTSNARKPSPKAATKKSNDKRAFVQNFSDDDSY